MSRFFDLAWEFLRPGAGDRLEGFERDVRAWFGQTPAVFLFHKGRVGLHAVGRALGLRPGDEVVLPGYTCVVVPEACRCLGARLVYVDIDPATYNTPAATVLAALTDRTRLVLVQHTYGIPAEADAVIATCRARGICVVEDCCHAFGTRVNGRLAGTLGDAAFLSGQWNKPFSTGLGGMLVVNDPGLADRVQRESQAAIPPSAGKTLELGALLLAHAALVNPRTHGWAQTVYRALTRLGLVTGSSTPGELTGQLPRDYFRRMSAAQAAAGRVAARGFERGVAHRLELQALYRALLPSAGFPPAPEPAGTVLSRYPVRVGNKDALVRRGAWAGVEVGSWFETPLHPVPVAESPAFGYRPGACLEAERAAREVVNLPIHVGMGPRHAERAVRFLEQNAARL